MARLKTANPFGDEFFADPPAPPARELPQSATTKGPTVRLNLDIDRALHRQLKQLALNEDRSIADVVRDLIAQAVTK
jgi:hypothetical protein